MKEYFFDKTQWKKEKSVPAEGGVLQGRGTELGGRTRLVYRAKKGKLEGSTYGLKKKKCF